MAVGAKSDGRISATTPLGPGVLLPVGLSGREAISEPFAFQLDLVAANDAQVPFEALLAQPIIVALTLASGGSRFVSGIVRRFGRGARGPKYTSYSAELVPSLWLLTRSHTSRIFQQISVPDILRMVLAGLDVDFELQGAFQPRNYCVQYRETDFNFVSRLMEEEGIFYFFEHAPSGHRLVVANTPHSHPDVSGPSTIVFDPTGAQKSKSDVVFQWEVDQALRSGLTTLRDTNFQLPGSSLEPHTAIVYSVQVGTVTHHLSLPINQGIELYDYPGGYAKRFDGIDPGGGEQPAELAKIGPDGDRTAAIRMQQQALPTLDVMGAATDRRPRLHTPAALQRRRPVRVDERPALRPGAERRKRRADVHEPVHADACRLRAHGNGAIGSRGTRAFSQFVSSSERWSSAQSRTSLSARGGSSPNSGSRVAIADPRREVMVADGTDIAAVRPP